MLSLLGRSRLASRPSRLDVRPRLEELENRITPTAALPPSAGMAANATFSTTTTITNVNVAEAFGPYGGQTETITGQVVFNGIPVKSGTVTVTDAGQTFTAPVNSSGSFTATFNFTLLQEFFTAPSHIVNLSYGGVTVGGTTVGASSTSVNTPDETISLAYQLALDYYILVALGY